MQASHHMLSTHPMEMPAFDQIVPPHMILLAPDIITAIAISKAAVAVITKVIVVVIVVHTIPGEAILMTNTVELTSFAPLNCLINIIMDAWPPESIRDETLHPLLALVSQISMTTMYSSLSVCPRHYKAFYFVHLVFGSVSMIQQSPT